MGNEIPHQLAQFFRSILLGGTLALLYDIARSLRPLGGKWWEILLDAMVSVGSVFALFLLVMAEEGELRLFILMGTLGGALLFFTLLSAALRPVLSFWVGILLTPLRVGYGIFESFQLFLKKAFSFLMRWFTIISTHTASTLRGGRVRGKKNQTKEDSPQQ